MLTENCAVQLILVVEDDENHAELIQRSFDDYQAEYRLEIVATLSAARAAVEECAPALVLTDYRLPDGDGSELVVLAAGEWPVVIMTSHGNERVAVDAMKIGAQDYIVKTQETFENLPRIVTYALMSWALKTSHRKASEAVLLAKKDWERTFDAVPDLIAIVDADHIIMRVNKTMADYCGSTSDKLVGRKCCELVHGPNVPSAGCPVAAMMSDGCGHAAEVDGKGLGVFFDVTVSPLYDEENRLTSFVHVMRDISARKRAEEERKIFEAQFQQTQKLESLGVLAGGIAHDFNNILTIIMGHCYIVKEEFDSGMSDKEHVEKIEAAASRAANLCRQMLAYAGNSPLLSERINLWLLVDEIVKMLRSAIKKNVAIQLDLKRDVPEIFGDNAQIQQIIMNLVINAAEAIGNNNGAVKVAIRRTPVYADQSETDFLGNVIMPGEYACLEVSDDGCGMDEDVKHRIFEPFYTTKFTGRGLGMSVILGIINSHKGALQFDSSPGCGTTFRVYFPVPDKAVVADAAQSPWQMPATTMNGTVLLVDDEESLRSIGSALLSTMGFTTVTAANGNEALSLYKARTSEIDLVLMDLIMPEMGGVDTYHELRKFDSVVPIIFCSGYGAESVAEITTTDENTCFLHKPFNKPELCRTVNEVIASIS